jgi:hypothetical protein
MSFPMRMETIVHIVQLLFGTQVPTLVNKFREFVTQDLPPGFPVRLHAPVFPTISFDLAIKEFEQVSEGNPEIEYHPTLTPQQYFEIPQQYTKEEETEEAKEKRQKKYRKRWRAAEAKKGEKGKEES